FIDQQKNTFKNKNKQYYFNINQKLIFFTQLLQQVNQLNLIKKFLFKYIHKIMKYYILNYYQGFYHYLIQNLIKDFFFQLLEIDKFGENFILQFFNHYQVNFVINHMYLFAFYYKNHHAFMVKQ
ncbi:hypothetical protein IMG5_150540, partial [Ichthyophthirius multifiliis]